MSAGADGVFRGEWKESHWDFPGSPGLGLALGPCVAGFFGLVQFCGI